VVISLIGIYLQCFRNLECYRVDGSVAAMECGEPLPATLGRWRSGPDTRSGPGTSTR